MTNLILIVKAILAIQAMFDRITELIVESQDNADREVLHAAIAEARAAKTTADRAAAARKIEEAFGPKSSSEPSGNGAGVASGSSSGDAGGRVSDKPGA